VLLLGSGQVRQSYQRGVRPATRLLCPALPCPAVRADPTLACWTASEEVDEDDWSAGAE